MRGRTLAASALLAMIAISSMPSPAWAQCEVSRKAWAAQGTLVAAAQHIGCLEATLITTGPPGGWRPTPISSTGPSAGNPTFTEVEDYLKWLREQYVPDESIWSTAIGNTLPTDAIVIDRFRIEQVAPELLFEIDPGGSGQIPTYDYNPSLDIGMTPGFGGGGMP